MLTLFTAQEAELLLTPNFRTALYLDEVIEKKSLRDSDSRLCIEIEYCIKAGTECQTKILNLLSNETNAIREVILISDQNSEVDLSHSMVLSNGAKIVPHSYIQEHLRRRAPYLSEGLLHAISSFFQFSLCSNSKVLLLRKQGDLLNLIQSTASEISKRMIIYC